MENIKNVSKDQKGLRFPICKSSKDLQVFLEK